MCAKIIVKKKQAAKKRYTSCVEFYDTLVLFQYITLVHFYDIKKINVDANLDAPDNVIMGNEPSSEMLTSQSKKPGMNQTQVMPNTPFTRSKNYLDRYLDCNLDRDPEVVPVYTGHSLFNTTNIIYV